MVFRKDIDRGHLGYTDLLTGERLVDQGATVSQFYDENPLTFQDSLRVRADFDRHFSKVYLNSALRKAIPKNGYFLDVGCGDGGLANYVALRHDISVFGADISIENVKRASKLSTDLATENCSFVRCDALRHPFADNSFDVISARLLLQQTKDPAKTFGHIARACKPNGWVLIELSRPMSRLHELIARVLFKNSPIITKRIAQISKSKSLTLHPRISYDECIRFAASHGFDVVRFFPDVMNFVSDDSWGLTNSRPLGNFFDRLLTQVVHEFLWLDQPGNTFVLLKKVS